MSTPVALPSFTVSQYLEEAQTPEPPTTGAPVSFQPLPMLVLFTPSVSEVQITTGTVPFTSALDAIQGRVDTDGYLKGLNSEPVYYVSGTTINPTPTVSSAGLPVTPVYTGTSTPAYWIDANGNEVTNPAGVVQWGVRLVSSAAAPGLTYRVDYTGGDVHIDSFRFAAPLTDTLIDLSVVDRLPL